MSTTVHIIHSTSPAWQAAWDLVECLAPSPLSLLIQGESGTGKELVAEAVHEMSGRPGQMVAVHCGAIARDVMESELFGHEKGAFTGATQRKKGRFELADGGTIFLDEVGDMPPDMQVKLLRVLESGEVWRVGATAPIHVDVRVVAASHKSIADLVRSGDFREDLWQRLAMETIHLPSLTQRPDALEELARAFAAGEGADLAEDALEEVRRHPWPGNVRELRACMRTCAWLSGGTITGRHIREWLERRGGTAPVHARPDTRSKQQRLVDWLREHPGEWTIGLLQESAGARRAVGGRVTHGTAARALREIRRGLDFTVDTNV